jgi:FeS assembly SUF system protein
MVTKKAVLEVLKTCYDPEIPVNIVDLGLIYGLKINKGKIDIKMTLTSPHCPIAEPLIQSIKNKLMLLKGVKDVNIELTFNPPWSKDRMSASAKRQLGLY